MERSKYSSQTEKQTFSLPGIYIPPEVLFHPSLSQTEKHLFGFLKNLSQTEKGCWATNKWLGRLIGAGKQTVSNCIANLKKFKLIIVQYEEIKNQENIRRIFINPEYPQLYRKVVTEWHKRLDDPKVKDLYDESILAGIYSHINELIYPYKSDYNKIGNINKEENNRTKKSFSKEKESNSGSNEPLCSSCVNEEENKIKRRRLSSSEKLRSAAKAKRLEPNTYEAPKITSKVQEVLDYWREQELHLPKEGTKEYAEGIKKIKRLFSGKLFDQKFTADDIKLSIDRFSLACFDNEIKPENKAYKKELKKMSLSRFIENSYSKKDKSLFLYYYNNQPESAIEKEENNFPEITQYLIDKYKKQALSNANIEFNQKQINQFIMAANRIKEFFEKNKRKLHPASRPGDIEKAKYLVDAIIERFGYSISPGHFCSDNTFNSVYPAYLTKQGILFYEEAASSISELNRSFKPKEEDDEGYSAGYFSSHRKVKIYDSY